MTDHDRIVQMAEQMETVYRAVMGNGKPGLIEDVSKLKVKMQVAQWTAGAFVLSTLGGLSYWGYSLFVPAHR